MIKYRLKCKSCKHVFDSWFSSSKEYEKLKKLKLINCNTCNSLDIDKSVMSPRILLNTNLKQESKFKKVNKIKSKIKEFQSYIKENFDYVGEKFTEEAKKIKYGETQDRPIYGEASMEQTKDLINEEIDIVPLPFSSKKTN